MAEDAAGNGYEDQAADEFASLARLGAEPVTEVQPDQGQGDADYANGDRGQSVSRAGALGGHHSPSLFRHARIVPAKAPSRERERGFSFPVFSNAAALKASGQQILIDTAARGPLPRTLVIDFEEVFYTDASGAESIRGLKRYASRYDVQVLIARLNADARQTLARDGVLAEIGEDHIDDSVHAAVAASNESTEQEEGACSSL